MRAEKRRRPDRLDVCGFPAFCETVSVRCRRRVDILRRIDVNRRVRHG